MKKFLLIVLTSVIASALTTYLIISNRGDNASETYVYKEDGRSFDKEGVLGSQELPAFTHAAEMSVKAVVYVKVVKKTTKQVPSNILEYFFGYGPSMPQEQVGMGSGVIITPDGYIVTNNHVVEGASEIEVTMDNNKVFKAKLVGTDPVTDVAILKIDAVNLPVIEMGNSDNLRLGEWVLAIGSPYDLRSTITAGIVSAKGRSMPRQGEFKIEAFIQTDAAVNPGNSGGALVNTSGELVGINTAIISRTGQFTGYSFAIPVNIVKKIASDLIDFGSVKRALLGITMQEIDDTFAKEMKLSTSNGVYIREVIKKGAADKAGIKVGDVLIRIDSAYVDKGSDVQEVINRFRPGEEISVTVIRDNKEKVLKVKLIGVDEITDPTGDGTMFFGATISNASQESLAKVGLTSGVEVTYVGNGKLMSAGIEEGFIITYVNQNKVNVVDDVVKIAKKSKRSLLIEGVYPDGSIKYYAIGL